MVHRPWAIVDSRNDRPWTLAYGLSTMVRYSIIRAMTSQFAVAFGVCMAWLLARPVSAQRPSDQGRWIPTWGTAQQVLPVMLPPTALQTLKNQTVRMVARPGIGGKRARVKLSNAFGGSAVTI